MGTVPIFCRAPKPDFIFDVWVKITKSLRLKENGMSKEIEHPKSVPFKKHEVAEYERTRYRGIDQRLVQARERRILKKILDKIGSDSTGVLDIPCGYGRFSDLLLARGFKLMSCDLSFPMVKRAIERSAEYGPSLGSGAVADAKNGLPFKSNSFDVIFSMRFFHHVHEGQEREFILKEFSRIASEWVILSYYRMNFLHLLQRRFRRKIKKSRTRIKMIPHKQFQKEIEQGGLDVIEAFPLFRGLHAQHIALLKKAKT